MSAPSREIGAKSRPVSVVDQTVCELELAEKQAAEARNKIWRENSCPHAITEQTVPSPIFVAAIIGVEKLLRIDLDATQGPVSFVGRCSIAFRKGSPCLASLSGSSSIIPPTRQSGSIQMGNQSRSWIRLSVQGPPFSALGRPIPAEALGLVFGK
jgi:hypothetical protein